MRSPFKAPKMFSSTQPTVSTTRIRIITMARTIGRLKERRAGMIEPRGNAAGRPGKEKAIPHEGMYQKQQRQATAVATTAVFEDDLCSPGQGA